MYPKEELAQPVGNAKIRGDFDTDAAAAVGPNTNGAILLPRLRSDHDGNMTGLQTPKHSVAFPGTSDVIRRFNRDTARLAMLVMGVVVLAVLVLAALVQERHPKAADPTEQARQAEGDLLLNASPATRFTVVDLSGKRSIAKTTSGQATSIHHAFTEIFPKGNPSSQMEAAASTLTPVLTFTPEIDRHDVQANAGSWTAAHRQDSGRVIGLRAPRARSRFSGRFRFVDVKMHLIALWHQSLARSEKSRNWTAFSNSNKGERRKVGYTAEMYH